MKEKSLVDKITHRNRSSIISSELTEMASVLNLMEMEKLRKKLDDYYQTIYGT